MSEEYMEGGSTLSGWQERASPQKGRLKAESEPQGGIWKKSILGGENSNCTVPEAEVGWERRQMTIM